MRHSDSKTDFSTGAHRDSDEGKGQPSLISPVLIHRLGVLLQKGAEHYGADNWAKGMPYRRTADSMIRHIFQWLAGDTEEDHLAAVCFGAMCLMTYEEFGKDENGVEDSGLDDRDQGLKKILASILTSPPKDAMIETEQDVFCAIVEACKAAEPQPTRELTIGKCYRCGYNTAQSDRICLWCKHKEFTIGTW